MLLAKGSTGPLLTVKDSTLSRTASTGPTPQQACPKICFDFGNAPILLQPNAFPEEHCHQVYPFGGIELDNVTVDQTGLPAQALGPWLRVVGPPLGGVDLHGNPCPTVAPVARVANISGRVAVRSADQATVCKQQLLNATPTVGWALGSNCPAGA